MHVCSFSALAHIVKGWSAQSPALPWHLSVLSAHPAWLNESKMSIIQCQYLAPVLPGSARLGDPEHKFKCSPSYSFCKAWGNHENGKPIYYILKHLICKSNCQTAAYSTLRNISSREMSSEFKFLSSYFWDTTIWIKDLSFSSKTALPYFLDELSFPLLYSSPQ